MKIQSNKSWYKAISNVNQIFYESSFNNPLTTIPPQFLNVRVYILPRKSARTIVNNVAVK